MTKNTTRMILTTLLALLISGPAFTEDVPHSFEAGTPVSASEMNENFQALTSMIDSLVPVGTVIASILPPVDMQAQYGDTWKLANGDAAPATYTAVTGEANLPDLRGVFLRGLNEGRGDGYEDPDSAGRTAGDPQMDQFQGHSFGTSPTSSLWYDDDVINGGAWGTVRTGGETQLVISTDGTNGTPRYGSETRPKNAAVYYYVKVK